MKPDGQNSVIQKWMLPDAQNLSFSDRWSRGTKTLGTRLRFLGKKFLKNSISPESLLATKPLTKEPEDSGYEIEPRRSSVAVGMSSVVVWSNTFCPMVYVLLSTNEYAW